MFKKCKANCQASAMFACVPSVCVYLPPKEISDAACAEHDIPMATNEVKKTCFFIRFPLF